MENNPILTQRHLNSDRPNSVTCAGHADLIQTKEGDWWAVFLACRPINNQFENLGRETFMMPVKWSEDGFPYMTQGDDLVPMIVKREGVKRDTTVTYGNFELVENFDSPVLDMPWMTLRTSASDLYSLSETPGYLTLKCADISATERKLRHLFVVGYNIINLNVLHVCCSILLTIRKQPECCCLKMRHINISSA